MAWDIIIRETFNYLVEPEKNENSTVTQANIPHATVLKIGIFVRFLFLRRNLNKCVDLLYMAVYNRNNSRSKSTQDYDEDTRGIKGMLKLGGTAATPKYDNAPEDFEVYW